jgi:hypothetical protein
MTLQIAAICALNPALNSGMITVDAALDSFMEKNFPGASVVKFNVERQQTFKKKPKFACEFLDDISQLRDFDRIVCWGDFLHAYQYHRRDLRPRIRNRNTDAQVAEQKIQAAEKMLFLSDFSDEELSKAVCFGGSIYVNGVEDELIKDYKERISRLYKNSGLVLMRDILSASFAQRYAAGRRDGMLGVDCAFLLEPHTGFSWTKLPFSAKKSKIGFSFGRRLSKDPEFLRTMHAFVHAVAEARSCNQIVDLDWLGNNTEDPVGGVIDKLSLINECQAVITDIYHCSINSWREGVPTFCVGEGAESPTGTLSEKKKELLYMMLNARDFYIFKENLTTESGFSSHVKRASAMLVGKNRIGGVNAIFEDLKREAERRLIDAMVERVRV